MKPELLIAIFLMGCSSTPALPADAGSGLPDRAAAQDRGGPDAPGTDAGAPDVAMPDLHPPDLGVVAPLSWVAIEPGTFLMGSPPEEACREPDEVKETQHEVALTHRYEIATTEVTQSQFHQLVWFNPAKNAGCGDCPVEMVSWHEAAFFCNRLSQQQGLVPCYNCAGGGKAVSCSEAVAFSGAAIYDCPGYRLPTEAEWEMAYRAGSTTALHNGPIADCLGQDANADGIGWFKSNSGGVSHPVGQKQPNGLGLRDMAGNVWEWCHDWLKIDLGPSLQKDPWGAADEKYYRITRGGSWFGNTYNVRAARRFYKEPGYRCHGIGLRPVRSLP